MNRSKNRPLNRLLSRSFKRSSSHPSNRSRQSTTGSLLYRLLSRNDRLRRWLVSFFTPLGLGMLCCLLTAGLIGLDIKRSLSYQIFAFLAALLLVALLYNLVWSIVNNRRPQSRLKLKRLLPRFGTVGVPLQYQILLHNPSRQRRQGLTLKESFSASFPSVGDFQRVFGVERKPFWHHKNSFKLFNPKKEKGLLKQKKGFRRRAWLKLLARQQQAIAPPVDLPIIAAKGDTEVLNEIIPLHRGRLLFQSLTVAQPDPLGLINCTERAALPESVLILPKRYQLPVINLPGSRLFQAGDMAQASLVGESEEFRALREYRPGDPLRKIHWKSWAKTGRPIVKEEQSEFSVRHALVLDTFVSSERDDDVLEEAVEEAIAIAASFACSIQADGQQQGSLLDMVFVGLEPDCFTVGAGAGHAEQLLELLAALPPCQDRDFSSLLPVVQQQLALLSGCICVLLCWDDDRKALVEQLQAAGVPTLVLLLAGDQAPAEPPDMDWVRVPQSRLHILRLGNIQAGLLTL